MLISNDLYTQKIITRLLGPSPSSHYPLGTLVATYEVRRYENVRNLSDKFSYVLTATFRAIIPNVQYSNNVAQYYTAGAQANTTFDNYPAILINTISVTYPGAVGKPLNAELLEYSPKTINTAVQSATSHGQGDSAAVTHQHSSGSSTSQSNTYGASVSLGFFGNALTGGVSADYSHASGSSYSKSHSSAATLGGSSNLSDSQSFAVKDWGCNAYVDVSNTTPTWVWGQEYPWNVLLYNYTNENNPQATSVITLPQFVNALLVDKTQALPPSQLSQFGIDFSMKAMWIIEPTVSSEVTIAQNMQYYTANHSFIDGGQTPPVGSASINAAIAFAIAPITLDLCLLGLDPVAKLGASATSASGIIGFLPQKFFIAPAALTASAPAIPFKILATTNNLLISDTTTYPAPSTQDACAGFAARDTGLTASFTLHCQTLQLSIQFKVADPDNHYTLYLKHWKNASKGVKLDFVINGHSKSSLIKYVDSREAEGGENNLLSITLRNLDFSSVDFHDYLQLGLNTIDMIITPIDSDFAASGYQIRAISVERS